VRRFATIALMLSLVLGLSGAYRVFAQGDDKKEDVKKADAPKTEKAEAPKEEPKKAEAPKEEPKKAEAPKAAAAEAPLPTIPPEVEKKLEVARRAVAEAIVAAQDAGLVQTTVDPPPILDILLTGRATDASAIKDHKGVSPEVFAAWFTGFGKLEGFVAQKDVRIIQPSAGLKSLFDQRASLLNRHIDAVRKEMAAAAKKEEPKPAMKKDEAKKEEPKPAAKKDEAKKEEPKKDDAKKDDSAKKDDAKKDDAKKDDAKKDDAKKDDAKKDDSDKKDESK
jgi:hypothetical protein